MATNDNTKDQDQAAADAARIAQLEAELAEAKAAAAPADMDKKSAEAAEARKEAIAKIKDPKERAVIELYEAGKHTYAIAQEVYEFVTQETVGRVVNFIRKHYADDLAEVEDVESTKGYTGIGVNNTNPTGV